MQSSVTLSMIRTLILIMLLTFATACEARSYKARAEFQRLNPCPATGLKRGKCPGYIIDHIIPLCAKGPDHPSNMQWQTTAEAKEKDKEERRQCRKN